MITRWLRTNGILVAIWLCFLLRGFFYSILFPIWEGYDEYSHFAFIQHLSYQDDLPKASETRISREVQESLRLVPLPWLLGYLPPPHVTHDGYWKLPETERQRRQRELHLLPEVWTRQPATEEHLMYEAQQPPLYHWLLSFPLKAARTASLPTRVLLIRWLSVGLASLVIPLGFLIARRVFDDDPPALAAVALVAAMPEFLIDVSRVGNESLAVVLYSSLVYLALRVVEGASSTRCAVLLGVTWGLGLLTKAYFLASVPALLLTLTWALWREAANRKQILLNGLLSISLAALMASWWYWRTRLLTGSWSGQQDAVAVSSLTLWSLIERIPEVQWMGALDFIFVTHIWWGNWSFLQVRSWMYHLFEYIVLFAALGLLILIGRLLLRKSAKSSPKSGHVVVLISFYGFFLFGLAYHVLITFVNQGRSASLGWYIYCLVLPEVLLATFGLRALLPQRCQRWILPTGTALFALLELYASHFLLIPYYVGLIGHRLSGSVEAFHISRAYGIGLSGVLERLQANKPTFITSPVLIFAWLLFLVATLGLVVLTVRTTQRKAPQSVTHKKEEGRRNPR